ncbi:MULTISPECIES: alkaline phosphatase PhoX [Marinobacter]|uniref:alkaline phosphatase PhoX n=1 Tax=Marinobacter TaxID=2742 RepID=UPI003B42FE56|nr:DUF839 domain-containing protein [Marinobacter alkaliphilus]
MNYQRRRFLQILLVGGSTVAVSACVGGSGGGNPLNNPPAPNLNPVPDLGDTPADILAMELPLSPGPLMSIGPLENSGVDGILIPPEFEIRRVAVSGLTSSTAIPLPSLGLINYPWHIFPDGGAVFDLDDGGWIYVSNSEITPAGGVGVLRFNRDGEITDSYPILRNTRQNCAGGPTPWQTWLSCEEVPDGRVYECDPLGTPDTARELPALGIFNHEAVAVDLTTKTLYLTEDSGSGRLYRFRSGGMAASINGKPGLDMDNGILEVLEIEGFEAGAYQQDLAEARTVRRVRWVPVQSPDRPQSQVRSEIEIATGAGAPGTVFKGGEGIWLQELPEGQRPLVSGANNPLRAVVYFACKGDNRVYALDIDNDLIEVVFDNEQLIAPDTPFDDVDNITISPMGDVIVAEDGDAMRLMVMNPNGPSKILLQIPGGGSELTGPAFTGNGRFLYFSSQRGNAAGPGIPGLGITYELTIPERFRAG